MHKRKHSKRPVLTNALLDRLLAHELRAAGAPAAAGTDGVS